MNKSKSAELFNTDGKGSSSNPLKLHEFIYMNVDFI